MSVNVKLILIAVPLQKFFILYRQWLEGPCLDFFKEWEQSVMQRDDVTPAQQKKMLLSEATLTGIHMTGV